MLVDYGGSHLVFPNPSDLAIVDIVSENILSLDKFVPQCRIFTKEKKMNEKELLKLMERFAIVIVETIADDTLTVNEQHKIIVTAANIVVDCVMSCNKTPVPSLN